MDIQVASNVLAIVNSAAMNTGVHVSFQNMVFSGYMPRSGMWRKKEPSYTVSGNVNLCSHYGKQYGGSLKN